MGEFIEHEIITTKGGILFKGKHRPDLEKPNWHYYECDDGTFIHFRKEHMVMVKTNGWMGD